MEKMVRKNNSKETRDMNYRNNSVVRRTINFLFKKMGYVRTSERDLEVGYLNERLSGEEKKNSNLHSSLYYYKTNYLKVKGENKVYEELFKEIGEKQMGLEKKVVTIKVQKKSKKTTKKVVGMKSGHPCGPIDKTDKTLTTKMIEGHIRTYKKSGKTIYIEPHNNYYWKNNDKMVG